MPHFEVFGKLVEQPRSIFGFGVAALLELDDVLPDVPIGFQQICVDGLDGSCLPGGVSFGDAEEEILVIVRCLKFCHVVCNFLPSSGKNNQAIQVWVKYFRRNFQPISGSSFPVFYLQFSIFGCFNFVARSDLCFQIIKT